MLPAIRVPVGALDCSSADKDLRISSCNHQQQRLSSWRAGLQAKVVVDGWRRRASGIGSVGAVGTGASEVSKGGGYVDDDSFAMLVSCNNKLALASRQPAVEGERTILWLSIAQSSADRSLYHCCRHIKSISFIA